MNKESIPPSKVPNIHIKALFGFDFSSEIIGESITLKTYDLFEEINIRVFI
tara:strand:- start:2 stop:154 length:153 start_codon:yes stop_codon:yes gene_type:complete